MTDSHEVERLTNAQRKFLSDTLSMGSLGFSADVLTGPESAMCGRLSEKGLLLKTFIPRVTEWHWQITDAGRALLNDINRKPTPEGK